MIISFNQNLTPTTHAENYIHYNSYNFSILSTFATKLDECIFNYRPSSRYRREIITRYNRPVSIVRDVHTQLFASIRDYNNTKTEEFAVKSIYFILRYGVPFLCQLINQKVKDAKKTAINGNRNPSITMKPNNVIDMYEKFNFNTNMIEYSIYK